MFSLLSNLTKAAVAVAVTPIAVAVDVLTLPVSSLDPHRGPFDRTSKCVDQVGAAMDEALKPTKD